MSQAEAQRLPGVWNVPYGRNPTFTGRADDLDRLRQGFVRAVPRFAVQAIHGLGGIGKTQLALEYAYRFATDYDVVWWLRADEPASLAADFADLAVALRMPGSVEPGQRAAVEAVKQWLGKNDRWLLIFNGARDPEGVKPYLPRDLRGHVLVTSRHAGWSSMALPLQLKPLKPSEGVELLLLRSGIHEGEEAAARELVAELGALPLALAQAGAYMEEAGTSVREYLKRFRERRAELMKRGATGTDAATVATTWDIAFREAKERSPAAVELLDLCSFLAPDDVPTDALRQGTGFPAALAAAVSDAFAFDDGRERPAPVLAHRVARRRPLHAPPGAGGGARSPRRARAPGLRGSLALMLTSDAFPDVPDDPDQRGACRRWLPHARAALANARAVAAPAGEPAERLLRHAAHYQYLFGFDVAAREMLEQAVKMAEALHGPDHAHVAMALSGLGLVLMRAGDLDGALDRGRRALRIDEKNLGHASPIVATDLVNLAAVLKEAHALDEARRRAEQALHIDILLGPANDAAVARDENNLGAILRELGDLAGARRCFERAIGIDQQRRTHDLARRLNNLGLLLREMGRLDEAEKLIRSALLPSIGKASADGAPTTPTRGDPSTPTAPASSRRSASASTAPPSSARPSATSSAPSPSASRSTAATTTWSPSAATTSASSSWISSTTTAPWRCLDQAVAIAQEGARPRSPAREEAGEQPGHRRRPPEKPTPPVR